MKLFSPRKSDPGPKPVVAPHGVPQSPKQNHLSGLRNLIRPSSLASPKSKSPPSSPPTSPKSPKVFAQPQPKGSVKSNSVPNKSTPQLPKAPIVPKHELPAVLPPKTESLLEFLKLEEELNSLSSARSTSTQEFLKLETMAQLQEQCDPPRHGISPTCNYSPWSGEEEVEKAPKLSSNYSVDVLSKIEEVERRHPDLTLVSKGEGRDLVGMVNAVRNTKEKVMSARRNRATLERAIEFDLAQVMEDHEHSVTMIDPPLPSPPPPPALPLPPIEPPSPPPPTQTFAAEIAPPEPAIDPSPRKSAPAILSPAAVIARKVAAATTAPVSTSTNQTSTHSASTARAVPLTSNLPVPTSFTSRVLMSPGPGRSQSPQITQIAPLVPTPAASIPAAPAPSTPSPTPKRRIRFADDVVSVARRPTPVPPVEDDDDISALEAPVSYTASESTSSRWTNVELNRRIKEIESRHVE